MVSEIPIACSLNEKELQERRASVLDRIAASLIEVRELADGFSYRFPADDAVLEDLIAVVNLERKCCPFLNFRLTVESGKNTVSLELTGREGTKEAVRSLFNWN